MNPEEMQEENPQSENMAQQEPEMTPEEAKASLGVATRLSEQMLMAQNEQIEEAEPEEAPITPMEEEVDAKISESEKNIDSKLTAMEDRLSEKIDGLAEEMKSDDSKELEDVKKQLEEILKEDE